MSPLMIDEPFGAGDAFTIQPHGHRDMVQASTFNPAGNRFAIGSADGRIKVYDRHRDGTWNICDTWTAHSGSVLEIHWLPSTIHPNLVASIGSGGKFRLWAEDSTRPPNSGRRFNSGSQNRPVYEMRSPRPRFPFLSFSITHNPETRHSFLALVDRSAMLTVYENEEPESMTSWTQIDQFMVLEEKPAQGEEVSFKVSFDPNLEPSYTAIHEGVPRDSLGIIVAGMNTARIWRTKVISHEVSLGAGSTREFYLAADLQGHRGLVRDVAWAPGSIRGFDICATICKDGLVRVFEVRTPPKEERSSKDGGTSKEYAEYPTSQVATRSSENGTRSSLPSGIGAGLATVRLGTGNRGQDAAAGGQQSQSQTGQVAHVVKEVARLDAHRGGVWRARFDDDGQMLGTTGDDGKLMLWRRLPDGGWARSGELAMNRSMTAAALNGVGVPVR